MPSSTVVQGTLKHVAVRSDEKLSPWAIAIGAAEVEPVSDEEKALTEQLVDFPEGAVVEARGAIIVSM